MSNITCSLSCGTILFNKMIIFVSTGSFMYRATLSYLSVESFTIRHKILINKTSQSNKTIVLNFNIKIIRHFITKKNSYMVKCTPKISSKICMTARQSQKLKSLLYFSFLIYRL